MNRRHLYSLLILVLLQGCIQDTGKVTMTYEKATAVYGDLEALRNQELFTASRAISDAGKIFIGEDFLLIGEEGQGIHIFDNSSPENPVNLGFINIFGTREFYLQGNDLYAESFYDMVKIDLSDIRQPQLIARLTDVFASPLENAQGEQLIGFDFQIISEEFKLNDSRIQEIRNSLNGAIYVDFEDQLIPRSAVPSSFAGNSNGAIGTVNRISEHNGYVYVIGKGRLTIFSSNDSFEFLTHKNMGWEMETVYPLDDRLFIGAQSSMDIYNLGNPTDPQFEGQYWHPVACDPVLPVDGQTAYLSLRSGNFGGCEGDTNELLVLDTEVINGGEVRELQSFALTSPYGMTLKGNTLYVGEGANGLAIFDATNRRELTVIAIDRSIEAYDIIPHPTRSDLLLIAGPDGFSQYEIQASDRLSFLSSVRF